MRGARGGEGVWQKVHACSVGLVKVVPDVHPIAPQPRLVPEGALCTAATNAGAPTRTGTSAAAHSTTSWLGQTRPTGWVAPLHMHVACSAPACGLPAFHSLKTQLAAEPQSKQAAGACPGPLSLTKHATYIPPSCCHPADPGPGAENQLGCPPLPCVPHAGRQL